MDKIIRLLKIAVKKTQFNVAVGFLAVSMFLVIISPAIFASIQPIYSGDYAKTFKGVNTVEYTEPSIQYTGNEWKNYDAPASNLYIDHLWYSWHWRDSGISGKEIKGDQAQKIMYELSILEPTGEWAEAINKRNGEKLADTYWLQTIDGYYRIPNDNQKTIIKVGNDYFGAGEIYTLPDKVFALIRNVYSGFGKRDRFSGSFGGKVLTVTKTYNGEAENSLIITDFVCENDEKYNYKYYATFTFTAVESGDYTISGIIQYSEDNFGSYPQVTFTAKKGKPVTVKVPFSSEWNHFNISFKCGEVDYSIYVND